MIALDRSGEGEPLVLLHGVGATRRIWRDVTPPLAAARTVLAPDLPGFGDSPPVAKGFDLGEVADALAAEFSQAGRLDLLGNSLGGAVAFVLARRHPELVRRLILSAPAGFWTPPGVVAALAERLSGPGNAARGLAGAALANSALARRILLWGAISEPAGVPPDMAREMLTASLRARRYGAAIGSVLRADLRAELARLQVPLGVIWGDRDRIVPIAGLDSFREARPEIPHVVLAGVAHVPQVEAPARFVSAVESLLARLAQP